MILVVDNYDSFTYNLVQYLGEVTDQRFEISVRRNDSLSVADIIKLNPSHIVLSPGPCTPNEAGICVELIQQLYQRYPILGVCLGHQAIGQAFGGNIIRNKTVFHGKTSLIHHREEGIFRGVANPFIATRYHSLIIDQEQMPDCLTCTAWTEDGTIMGVVHKNAPHVVGVQFHPESILTTVGKTLLANFVDQWNDRNAQ